MKTLNQIITLLILVLLGCNREVLQPGITLDASSDCKSILKSGMGIPGNQDCIQYSFQDNRLVIKHINAGFNCCPEGFKVSLAVKGDTLIITEEENSSLCDCNCLFDLDYTLTDIDKDSWWIRVVEPYVQGQGQDLILFEANLRKDTSGLVCFERTTYPWRF